MSEKGTNFLWISKDLEQSVHLDSPFSICQGQVAQSIISLMRMISGQLIKSFIPLLPNTLIFFVQKMREALQKLLTMFGKASDIFPTKDIGIFEILTFVILAER